MKPRRGCEAARGPLEYRVQAESWVITGAEGTEVETESCTMNYVRILGNAPWVL
jgi:hypothetical protein